MNTIQKPEEKKKAQYDLRMVLSESHYSSS